MARVTIDEVVVILPKTTALEGDQIQAAIDSASCLVDMIAADCASDLTEACLKQIELYLSAHFAAVSDFTLSLTSEKDACCGGEATYGFKLGEGIKGTPFGQMANTLSGGCLLALDAPAVGFFSIGSLDGTV